MQCSLGPENPIQYGAYLGLHIVTLRFVKQFISLNCSRKDDFVMHLVNRLFI